MDQKRARDSCTVASIIREKLVRASQDRLYQRSSRYGDVNHTLLALAGASSLLRKACHCGYYGAAQRLHARIERQVQALRRDLDDIPAEQNSNQKTPTIRQLAGELRQIEEEFGEWKFEPGVQLLSVRTGPIHLEEVYLGPFSIELELSGLSYFSGSQAGAGQHPFRVVALDPHPAAGNRHVTHPHVSDERLCTGESTPLISAALMNGRLADFFLIVRGLLQTYNPDSPYVALDVWTGTSCNECGDRVHEDDRYYCESCDHDVCDGCTGRCQSCDESACLGCLINCKHCEAYHCVGCMKDCTECGSRCCVDCLDEKLCPPCVEAKENQSDPENTEEQEATETAAGDNPVEATPVEATST
jgi:hypothetical protein